jgi:hypothetical protein
MECLAFLPLCIRSLDKHSFLEALQIRALLLFPFFL